MTHPTPESIEAASRQHLPPITDDDRQFLHYNPNTWEVVEWVRGYALKAIEAYAHRLATPPASAEPQERWVVVRETVLDVGFGNDVRTGGRPELGYSLIAHAATFASEDEARAAHRSAELPLGWVLMPLSRLLPDLYESTPPQPAGAVQQAVERPHD